jgi:hypothetical protein
MYRTVAWGIRITAEAALTSLSGHLWITHVPWNMTTTAPYYDWPTTEASFAQLPLSEKFAMVELAERPVIAAGRNVDDGCYRFRTVNANEIIASGSGLESSYGWAGIVIYGAGLPASSSGILNVEFIQHIEFLQDGNALYGFIDALPCPYDEKEMVQASKAAGMVPVGMIEGAVQSVESASEVIGGLIGAGARVYKAVKPLMQLAGRVAQARGFNRGPPANPFALEYKDGYEFVDR